MKGRAAKRHKTRAKVEKARKILVLYGHGNLPDTQPPWKTLAISARKFAASHFGCACWDCANPRKVWKGKDSRSLPLKEYHNVDMRTEA